MSDGDGLGRLTVPGRLRVPGRLAARARDISEGRLEPAVPRDAATVMLLRTAPEAGLVDAGRGGEGRPGAGPAPRAARDPAASPSPSRAEVYMLRRLRTMAFAPGVYVFPGGSVDDRDAEDGHDWCGPIPEQVAPLLGLPSGRAQAMIRAAVRETFEECGVLLAGPTADSVVEDTSGPDWDADRHALADGSVSLAELLTRRGLVLRADLLRPWARWITPEAEQRRYDTRFFVAALPTGQRARGGTGEADEAAWLRPDGAIAAAEAGQLMLLPPTAITLRELAGYPDVPAILTAERRIVVRQPEVVFTDGQAVLVIPGDQEDGE